MFNLLPTETVVFSVATKLPPDPMGEVRLVYTDHTVTDCLVQPVSMEDLRDSLELFQNTSIAVHVPKSFTEDLTNCKLLVRGVEYFARVVRPRVTVSPLLWDREVLCEVID